MDRLLLDTGPPVALFNAGDALHAAADACLVWAAKATGIHRIATIEVRDFSVHRIQGRTRFMIEPLA